MKADRQTGRQASWRADQLGLWTPGLGLASNHGTESNRVVACLYEQRQRQTRSPGKAAQPWSKTYKEDPDKRVESDIPIHRVAK